MGYCLQPFDKLRELGVDQGERISATENYLLDLWVCSQLVNRRLPEPGRCR